MTTNYQIEHYLKGKAINFRGVYASNEISSLKLPLNSSIIVNYSPSNTRGSHWIGIKNLNNKNKPPEYFDSYGFVPDHDDAILGVKTNFSQFLELRNLTTQPIKYNNKDLQAYGSDVCGEYSSYFILHGLPDTKNKWWKPILDLPTPQQRDNEIKKLVPIRQPRVGFRGDGIDKAKSFWSFVNPKVLKIFEHDIFAPLSLYYGLKRWVMSNTTRQITEYLKLTPKNFEYMHDWLKQPLEKITSGLPIVNGNNAMLNVYIDNLPSNIANDELKKNKTIILNIYNNLHNSNDKLRVLELFDDEYINKMFYDIEIFDKRNKEKINFNI